MERDSRLADLKLVAKYYPVTNYSYPHHQCYSHHARSSLGSETSAAPSLIDDRSDSEASFDEDNQYHAHTSELWDSFWESGTKANKLEEPKIREIQPQKQYPALIPSPHRLKRRSKEGYRNMAWPLPLPESPTQRNRKPAASYSAFPKPIDLPPRTSSLAPSWQSSRPRQADKPRRPPRPDDNLFIPYIQAPLAVEQGAMPTTPALFNSVDWAAQPTVTREHRPTASLEVRPSPAMAYRASVQSQASRSAVDLSLQAPKPPALALKKSTPCFSSSSQHQSQPEPLSVFEYDDSDSETETPHRSFFRFHRRAHSDDRRTSKTYDPGRRRRRRDRSSRPLSSPERDVAEKSTQDEGSPRKQRGSAVLGRVLGRRV